MIDTVEELINHLGGVTKAKDAFKVKTPSVVGNWVAANRIPPKHHYRGREICEREKLKVKAKFWERMA